MNQASTPARGFGRFTVRARNIVMAAQNEAHTTGNETIAPEHLVLGLVGEREEHGAQAITAQGVALETVRQAATAKLPPAAAETRIAAAAAAEAAGDDQHFP